jgi:hypothetical protein
VNLAARYTGDMGMMQGNKRVLIGVGVSIAVHLLLMFAYRNTGTPVPAFVPEPPSSIAVRILPPLPPPRQAEPAPPAPSAAKAARSARRSTPQSVIAVPALPEQEAAPDAFTVEQAAEPAPTPGEAPKFDMNAAKHTARELAGRTKLGIEGTALAQFPDPPLETETKAARAISRTKRANCKDGIPGGLLAPLFLMMDKKDHGCKW